MKKCELILQLIDFMLNELLKKVEYASIWVETINLKDLDKKTINRL